MSRVIVSLYDDVDSALQAVMQVTYLGLSQTTVHLAAHRAVIERTRCIPPQEARCLFPNSIEVYLGGIGNTLLTGCFAEACCAADLNGSRAQPPSLVHILRQDLIPDDYANAYTEGVRRKGTLVMVKAGPNTSNRVLQTLDQFLPVDIQAVMHRWRKAGWTHFDCHAQPLISEMLNWPSNITASPDDGLIDDSPHKSWPQNILHNC